MARKPVTNVFGRVPRLSKSLLIHRKREAAERLRLERQGDDAQRSNSMASLVVTWMYLDGYRFAASQKLPRHELESLSALILGERPGEVLAWFQSVRRRHGDIISRPAAYRLAHTLRRAAQSYLIAIQKGRPTPVLLGYTQRAQKARLKLVK